ncbi:hypothetical protein CsatB_028424 [Cannabis sativa]|uniref:Uncharacterized protein n=2 Tax=Cannabis sativa TaxID=3483 RepID=A0AB40E4Z1_CANSA|nr:uncharacterized protein LOC115721300 [Cannabis sativa]KAF4371048.1 hypothetical protein G4B88_002977 [Cannabis sativa]
MNRQVVQRSPQKNRRTPLLTKRPPLRAPITREKRRIGELAGGTAAECAAVCCCFPCALMNLLVLAVYKVPAGLCRKAWAKRKKRQRLAKMGLLPQRPSGPSGLTRDELEAEIKRVKEASLEQDKINGGGSNQGATSTVDLLEEEMWERFYGAGFWRSPSQRENEL